MELNIDMLYINKIINENIMDIQLELFQMQDNFVLKIKTIGVCAIDVCLTA